MKNEYYILSSGKGFLFHIYNKEEYKISTNLCLFVY